MPNKIRTANARAAASSYAPRPNGSTITYGLIAAALVLAAALVAGAFYGVDVVASPLPLVAALVVAFGVGAGLRRWRRREHNEAFDAEYLKRGPPGLSPAAPTEAAPTGAGAIATASEVSGQRDSVADTVTFRSPFMLPGLDQPHLPGTFQVLSRKEPLDVSWGAFVVFKTIMLPEAGAVEALEVKEDDLAEALRLDRANSGL